jgi:hypothetical protein
VLGDGGVTLYRANYLWNLPDSSSGRVEEGGEDKEKAEDLEDVTVSKFLEQVCVHVTGHCSLQTVIWAAAATL